MTPDAMGMKWLILRDCDHKSPIVFDGNLGELEVELRHYHAEHGDTGFKVWSLGQPTTFVFEPARLVSK